MQVNRRSFITGIAGAAALNQVGLAKRVQKKNVLFLAVDDLRTSIGCYGDTYAKTPNIDKLAGRGVLFEKAYCQQAVCNPSRQSLMTGRRPDSIRVWDLKTHFRNTSPGTKTLAEQFRDHGYFAQSFGKIFHGEEPMADPASWSVPEQFEYTPKQDDYQLERNHLHRTAGKADVDEWVDAPDDRYPDGEVAKGAVEALQGFARNRSQPFFLGVGMRKPHLPFTGPRKYWNMFEGMEVPPVARLEPPAGAPELALHDSVELRGYLEIPAKGRMPPDLAARLRRGYYAALAYTDAQFGLVLKALDDTGLAKDTLIVLWADHGYHLGEHDLWCKTTNYDLDTHVPLIIVDPSTRQRGKRCHATVELLDIFPTVCDLCGVPPTKELEGKSLRPWLEQASKVSTKPAFSQFPRPWFYKGAPEYMGYAVRTDTHRYVEWRKFDSGEVSERELYVFHTGDRIESDNRANDPQLRELVSTMSSMLPKHAPRSA